VLEQAELITHLTGEMDKYKQTLNAVTEATAAVWACVVSFEPHWCGVYLMYAIVCIIAMLLGQEGAG